MKTFIETEEHKQDQYAMIADKDSGYMYRMGIQLHCPGAKDGIDPELTRP